MKVIVKYTAVMLYLVTVIGGWFVYAVWTNPPSLLSMHTPPTVIIVHDYDNIPKANKILCDDPTTKELMNDTAHPCPK